MDTSNKGSLSDLKFHSGGDIAIESWNLIKAYFLPSFTSLVSIDCELFAVGAVFC